MNFVFMAGREALKRAPVLIRAMAKESLKRAPVIIRPAKDYTRGLVTGKVKYYPIAGSQGVTTGTITPFLRAGIQTRQATAYVIKKAVVSGPVTTAKAVVAVARTAVRDAVVLPYSYAVHGYQLIRLERLARGSTSLFERGADRYIAVSGRYLSRLGLEPRITGTVASMARVAVYGVAYDAISSGLDKADAAKRYVSATIANYEALADRVRSSVPPPRPDPAPVVVAPIVPPPVVSPSPVRSVPVPLAPPVPVSQRGAPVIYSPPVRR